MIHIERKQEAASEVSQCQSRAASAVAGDDLTVPL